MYPGENTISTLLPLAVRFLLRLANLILRLRKNIVAKAAAVFLLAFSSLVPGFATSQTPEEQEEAFFTAGQQFLKQGDYAHAVEEFKKVLALDPTLVEAEVNLGLAYQSLFQYDLAVRHLTKGLRARPNLVGPTVIVGMDYVKLGAPEKAIPFLERALKLDPSNREAHQALATCYLGQERFRSAAAEFREIAALDSDKSEAWFTLGHQYLDLAAHLAFRGAHLYRESAWGHRFLGDLLFERARWDDAVKEYQKALIAEPRQPGLHTSLGQTYLHAQKPDAAETEFRSELTLDPRGEPAWLGLANLQLVKGDATAALESLGKIWEISPEFLSVQRGFPSAELPQETTKASITRLGTRNRNIFCWPPYTSPPTIMPVQTASGNRSTPDSRHGNIRRMPPPQAPRIRTLARPIAIRAAPIR